MKNYRVRGIIVKRFDLYEADRLITLLTKERGLIDVRGKSIRKIKGKLKGALELFMFSEIELAEGQKIDVITGAQIIEPFENFRNRLIDTSAAFYLSEALIGLLAEGEPNQKIFNLFYETITELDRPSVRDRERELLLSYFLIKLLGEAGFKPELYRCLKCRERIKEGDNFFDLVGGGLVCHNCRSGKKEELLISRRAIAILRLLSQNEVGVSRKIKADRKFLIETRKILHSFIEYILAREVKSSKFFEEISQENAKID